MSVYYYHNIIVFFVGSKTLYQFWGLRDNFQAKDSPKLKKLPSVLKSWSLKQNYI